MDRNHHPAGRVLLRMAAPLPQNADPEHAARAFSEQTSRALEIAGVRLVGFTPENGVKLLLTVLFIAAIVLLGRLLRPLAARIAQALGGARAAFWARQGVNLGVAVLLLVAVISIWFDDPIRLATALGLVTAGLAFALRQVITAVAGYFTILRGKTFNVGDRIVMGGVRGDVVSLSLLQTTIMEMGQPPSVQNADPAQWVRARQYTGRIVTVSNSKIFDNPVFNYSRDFPFLWEELSLPVRYADDRRTVERILLEAARTHTTDIAALGEIALAELRRRYPTPGGELAPRVYYRLTDNWLELTVRFIVQEKAVREIKDAMSRDIITGLDRAGIGLASATFEVVGAPVLKLERTP